MLNSKTYAPSSYVGSPRFTRMEKTACTTFSDGEKYLSTKEVWLLLTLRLVSVVVTSYRSSTRPCLGWKTLRRTSGMSSRRGCRWTTSSTMGAWWLSTRTNWIVVRTICLLTIPPCTTSSTLGSMIWTPSINRGTLQRVPCAMRPVWGIASGPWLLESRTGSVCSVSLFAKKLNMLSRTIGWRLVFVSSRRPHLAR